MGSEESEAELDWETYLYVLLGCPCSMCGQEPDLEWAWEGKVEGVDDRAEVFSILAARYVRGQAWLLIGVDAYCPKCAPFWQRSD